MLGYSANLCFRDVEAGGKNAEKCTFGAKATNLQHFGFGEFSGPVSGPRKGLVSVPLFGHHVGSVSLGIAFKQVARTKARRIIAVVADIQQRIIRAKCDLIGHPMNFTHATGMVKRAVVLISTTWPFKAGVSGPRQQWVIVQRCKHFLNQAIPADLIVAKLGMHYRTLPWSKCTALAMFRASQGLFIVAQEVA